MKTNTPRHIVDWNAIMDICGYEDMVDEVVRSGLDDAQESATLLAEAVHTGHATNTALYAHRLKGVALVMGANRLAVMAEQLEHAGEARNLDAGETIFRDVQTELNEVTRFLSRDNWMDIAKQQANGQA